MLAGKTIVNQLPDDSSVSLRITKVDDLLYSTKSGLLELTLRNRLSANSAFALVHMLRHFQHVGFRRVFIGGYGGYRTPRKRTCRNYTINENLLSTLAQINDGQPLRIKAKYCNGNCRKHNWHRLVPQIFKLSAFDCHLTKLNGFENFTELISTAGHSISEIHLRLLDEDEELLTRNETPIFVDKLVEV